MKRTLWSLLIFGLLMQACQNPAAHSVTSDMIHFPATASGDREESGPEIVFDEDTFHFEMMAVGTSVQHTFQFKNTGHRPLIIGNVQPSCGCTVLKDWPQDPVQPGEASQITVSFNATGSEGWVDKTILVSTNCEPKDYILHIQGNIIGLEVKGPNTKSGVEMKRER
jgi:hypothetical protein